MKFPPNEYRTHHCGELTEANVGNSVRVAGWVDTIRDHGGVIFVDLRDQYGVVQLVFHDEDMIRKLRSETVISASGKIVLRDEETVNPKIPSGRVEVTVTELTVLGTVTAPLPFEIDSSTDTNEETRLRYRFLDLRNPAVHEKMLMRSRVISHLRRKMEDLGFTEMQTPILTCSSPEGARDYLVPSRKHKGKFYALPQAPQIFKQLLMVSGFDRYFQIAPCFRDEDARADRSPGEFYQLDFEMAFATQEDVFAVAEAVLPDTFAKFSTKKISPAPFPRITYRDALLTYGSDKPDLRNPLTIIDVTDAFADADFPAFKNSTIRAIAVPGCASKSKSFYENMLAFALDSGLKGLGYFKVDETLNFAGPIDKFLTDTGRKILLQKGNLKSGDTIFFVADKKEAVAAKLAGIIRTELGKRMELIDENAFQFCFIVDFPMYERNEETGKCDFMHNPFSMPQGGLEALNGNDPYSIVAYQYDIVCNGVELSSGAVRNHIPEVMVKAFELAGYSEEVVQSKFPALYTAFHYGAPPHAGMAPGVDRMVMLLANESNIREVIPFPMNQNAQDILLGAPTAVSEAQLREVHIKLR